MTRGPRRLKQDTDFKWETGCDLSDEEAVVGGYDHDRVRAKLLAAAAVVPAAELSVGDGMPSVRAAGSSSTGAGSAGSGVWGWSAVQAVVAGLAGAAVVAGAYVLGVQAGTGTAPEVAPIVAPAAPAEGGGVELEVRELAVPEPEVPELVPPAVELGGTAEAEAPVASPVAAPPEPETVKAAVKAAVMPPAFEPEAQPAELPSGTPDAGAGEGASSAKPAVSRFAEEGDAFGQARDALDAGRFDEARRLFATYLERFPEGSMRPEAHLGRLEAARGRWGATRDRADLEILAALSAELQDVPALAGRRAEIVRLRAESLVELGRCDEATSVSEAHSGRLAADIRRACRASRRE